MTSAPHQKRRGPITWLWSKPISVRWTVLVVTVLGSPVSYFLSIGPAAWLWAHVLPDSALPVLTSVYSPIQVVMSSTPGLETLVSEYQSLWVSQEEAMQRYKVYANLPPPPATSLAATPTSGSGIEIDPESAR